MLACGIAQARDRLKIRDQKIRVPRQRKRIKPLLVPPQPGKFPKAAGPDLVMASLLGWRKVGCIHWRRQRLRGPVLYLFIFGIDVFARQSDAIIL